MQTFYCFYLEKYPLRIKNAINRIRGILLCVLLLSVWNDASSQSISATPQLGGSVNVQGIRTLCRNCDLPDRPPNNPISLLAIPANGYRFLSWGGVCWETPGPLCTPSGQVSAMPEARFERVPVPSRPDKALLLLNDPSASGAVWNKLVQRYFNQRCPRIYGGVIVERDSRNTVNNVACYRIDFGYYKYLTSPITPRQSDPVQSATEIGAAVIAIRGRHLDASLVIISQKEAGQAAQLFLNDYPAIRKTIKKLLIVENNKGRGGGNLSAPAVLSINANPERTHLIDRALSQIVPDWWLNP